MPPRLTWWHYRILFLSVIHQKDIVRFVLLVFTIKGMYHSGFDLTFFTCFVSGDGKSAPNPLFRVKVILEGDKVEFSPTLKQLALIVGSIGQHLTEAIAGVRRLPDILTKKRSNKEVTTLKYHWVKSKIFIFV